MGAALDFLNAPDPTPSPNGAAMRFLLARPSAELPPGFTLDPEPQGSATLPEGFTLDPEPSYPMAVGPDGNPILDPSDPLRAGMAQASKDQSRALAEGATMGISDKIGAGVDATADMLRGKSFGPSYQRNLQAYRDASNKFATDNPLASTISNLSGMAAAVPVVTALTGGAAAPATLGRSMLQGGTTGAAAGAAAGFGKSNDTGVLGDFLDAAQGGVLGGIGGAVLNPIAQRVLSPLADWVSRQFSPDAVNNQAVRNIGARIAQNIRAGGPTAQDMLDIINAAPGKPQTLMDVGGQNVLGLAGNLARTPGESRSIVTDFLNNRDQNAGPRLLGDVNANISNGDSAFNTYAAMDAARRQAAAPLYQQAFTANPSVSSPEISQILQTPDGQDALSAATRSMQNARLTPPNSQSLSLQSLDYVKRALDDKIGGAIQAGASNQAGILTGLKNDLVDALDKADTTGGIYAQARAAYSGPSQSMKAMQNGQQLFTKSPDEIKATIADLSPGDQEFYKLGAADALRKKIMQTGQAGNEAKNIVGNQWVQNQLRPLFDSDQSYGRFIDAATAENRMFDTKYNVIGNSQTAPRLAEDAAGHNDSDMLGAGAKTLTGLVSGEPVMTAWGLVQALTKGAQNLGKPSPAVNTAMARLLTATDPRTISDVVGNGVGNGGLLLGGRYLTIPGGGLLGQSDINPRDYLLGTVAPRLLGNVSP